jgi:hypothetical protein
MVSATPHSKALQSITIRMAKSRMYLSGIMAEAILDIYTMNGRLLFKTIIPAGASEGGCRNVSQRPISIMCQLKRAVILSAVW